MKNSNQSSNQTQTQTRSWAALWPVLLLAPLAMAPKGCNSVVVGDDCPELTSCTAGSSGGDPISQAGTGNAPTGNGGAAGGKPTGNGGSSNSSTCGGLLGSSCAASDYCAYPADAICGAADQTGVCKPRPQVCNDISAPVCACDGNTYGNDCEAAAKGSSVLHPGACEEPTPGTSCGGLKPVSCEKGEFCNYPAESKCGAADQTGTCTKIPDACDLQFDPVCGCDGVTYSNACTAASKGASVLRSGACDGSTCGGLLGTGCDKGEFCNFPVETSCGSGDQTGTCTAIPSNGCDKSLIPVCGCDGKTYDNACLARAAGVSVAAVGECAVTCGGKIGSTCAADQYCSYPISANCGKADATGTCVSKPTTTACPANYDPVCGCDGKTYGNACDARNAGVSIAAEDACP